jgi:hypothetical protein
MPQLNAGNVPAARHKANLCRSALLSAGKSDSMNKFIQFNIGVALTCSIFSAFGQTGKKPAYHLFNPVPKAQMREMETDRPDVTESPFTVDAGHFQYEADLLRLERERDELTRQQTLLINQANLKLGVTRSTEVQLVLQSYGERQETDLATGARTKAGGFGELSLRLKQNLKGDDGGDFVLAVMPYVKFPTSVLEEQNRYEGGVIVPMQLKLPGEWKLGFQLEADRLKDKYGQGMHTELLQSLTFSHELIKDLDGIAETYYTYDFKQNHWANFLNAALQLSLSKDFNLDAGLNYGLQGDAEKNYFIGTSFRF